MVVVVVLRLVRRLVLRLRRRLVLRGRLERGLLLGLERGLLLGLRLRLVWGRQGGVQGPLETRLGVRGQKRLSRARQEGLSRRHEGPCGCGPWLAKVKKAHRPRRLEGWPGRPLSGEHRLLSLLIKRWPRLGEGQGAGRGHRVTTAKKRGRRRWWRGTSLFQEEMARESWFS